MLVARHVLRSYEMSAIYSQVLLFFLITFWSVLANSGSSERQVDWNFEGEIKLSFNRERLQTKTHWVGAVVDALIRSGRTSLAESILKNNSTSNTF
jgi:hypothetical protein